MPVKQEQFVGQMNFMPLKTMSSLPTLDQADYPDAAYWTQKSWQDYFQKREQRGEQVKKLGFICSEDGEFVGGLRIKSMTETAKKLWNQLHHHRLAPATWRLISQDAYEYYSNHMRATHPEFQFCEGDWKVKMFATIRYPDWSYGSRASGKLTRSHYVSVVFNLIFFVVGAIPSIDAHSQSKGLKRACNNENTKSLGKRRCIDTIVMVKPTKVVDLTAADSDSSTSTCSNPSSLLGTTSSSYSVDITADLNIPHLQPEPRPLYKPFGVCTIDIF